MEGPRQLMARLLPAGEHQGTSPYFGCGTARRPAPTRPDRAVSQACHTFGAVPRPEADDSPLARTARLLSGQGRICRELGSPLYGDLLPWAAADLLDGGPTAAVLDGYLSEPGSSALALRMLGAVHALALTGQAPDLAAFYPSAGGTASPGADGAAAWPHCGRR
jgi:Uncharacterized protein conserved in bacteria (DUF2332)